MAVLKKRKIDNECCIFQERWTKHYFLSWYNLAQKFEAFSVIVDGNTDVVDTAQLTIFIRGMDLNYDITEELVALSSMKGSITGIELYEQVMRTIEKFNLNLNKIYGITTDGAPVMVGKKSGLTALITEEMKQHTK
jgi:hypothetical protein